MPDIQYAAFYTLLFFFVIEVTVAIPLKLRIGYLIAKLLAHTLCLRRFFQTARAIPATRFKPGLNLRDYFLVLIESYFHHITPYFD